MLTITSVPPIQKLYGNDVMKSFIFSTRDGSGSSTSSSPVGYVCGDAA